MSLSRLLLGNDSSRLHQPHLSKSRTSSFHHPKRSQETPSSIIQEFRPEQSVRHLSDLTDLTFLPTIAPDTPLPEAERRVCTKEVHLSPKSGSYASVDRTRNDPYLPSPEIVRSTLLWAFAPFSDSFTQNPCGASSNDQFTDDLSSMTINPSPRRQNGVEQEGMRFRPEDPMNGLSSQTTSKAQGLNGVNSLGGSVKAQQTQPKDKDNIFRSSNWLISVTASDGESIDADGGKGRNFVIVVSGK
jgi:hypothetical protein